MEDTTVNMAEVSVPADDGAIAETLAELEGKLSAWCSAVAEIQTALAEQATSAATDDRAGALPPETQESQAVGTDASMDSDAVPTSAVAAEPRADETVADVPEGPEPGIAATEPATPAQEESPIVPPPEAPSEIADPGGTVESLEEPQTTQASTPQEDDEALLNSLDPEMAQAIRVMRRVSPVKKSVRELIEEYESKPSSRKASTPQKKKSWWRG